MLRKVTVNLNHDPNDGDPDYTRAAPDNQLLGASDFAQTVSIFYTTFGASALRQAHRPAGGAARLRLLYGTSCDLDGVDFLNMEAAS